MSRLAKIERKVEYFPCISEIKEVNDAKYQIGGYLNYLNNIDFGDDRTMPGAFRKTLQDAYARKTQQQLDFLYPYLFNHDYSQLPPGGIYDADEDKKGLYIRVQFNPDIQLARELFSSFKMKTMSKQSMGYKAIQVDWVKEEGKSIRNLLEVAVMEGSAVVFPMNDLAQVDTVKRRYFFMDTKGSASGKTSWPLADRGVSWDKGAAMKDIQAYATSGDSVDWSKAAQCFFWVAKSPPEHWGDCKFPFVAKSGGSMKAIPAAIFNGAARLDGANIDDKDGVKAKMASYYRKMKMTPPWEKGNTMDIWSKDYTESYLQTNQQDWVSDLWNLWYPLRNEILTAFQTGDTVVEDVTKALEQFSVATIAYVQEGIALDMNEFLQPDSGFMPSYMMSSDDNPETKEEKAGRAISAANHAKLKAAADGIKAHVATIHTVLRSASPLAEGQNTLSGYQVYSGNEPPEQKDDDESKEESVTDIHSMLHDLTLLLSADNANRGI
jgi:HK97 family phage prohead protease